MKLRTRFCEAVGIEVPVCSAGMAGTHAGPRLAAAVSNAGGLGGLGGVDGGGPEGKRRDIRETRELTSKPFSVNLWVFLLPAVPLLEVCIEERVPSITLSFGDPSPYVAKAKDAGIFVLSQVQTVAGAKQAVAAGVDAIIAQGGEAGGHTGSVATMALVPSVVDIAGDVPVLAAGGIADGRGLVAALALGAQAVVMGTRFVATEEATPPVRGHREKIIGATADDTVFTDVFDIVEYMQWPTGISGRSIRTAFSDEWHGREDELRASVESIRAEATGETPERAQHAYAGQSAGLVREVLGAGEVVRRVVSEAEGVLGKLCR